MRKQVGLPEERVEVVSDLKDVYTPKKLTFKEKVYWFFWEIWEKLRYPFCKKEVSFEDD